MRKHPTTETTESTESFFEKSFSVLSFLRGAIGSSMVILFLLDGLANAIDFAFHFWMGRVLIPSEFAILQTLNSAMLVYVTASGVFQPVVGRFVAEARSKGEDRSIPAIFQTFLRAALWLGLVIAIIVLVLSSTVAQLLNLPPWTIQLSAALIFLSTLRPVAAGVLQGQENFSAFGLTRLALSLGRIIIVFILIQAGFGLRGAVIALPFGWLVSIFCAFALLPNAAWKKKSQAPQGLLRAGWRLSFYALLAYIAYMSLASLDLVWANKNLGGDSAGAYASLVLMRRVVALLPGVAVTVMFPQVVSSLAQSRLPHRLLIRTAAIILAASGLLTILYFTFADQLIPLIFGEAYQAAAPLLGWMGAAMIGVSLSAIWLNYYLAEKPRNFVILLGIAVALEWLLLNLFPPSMQSAILAFGATGWLLALGGLVLYLLGRLPRRTPNDHRGGRTPPRNDIKNMPDFNKLYREHRQEMEDFWSRRANTPKYKRRIRVFGHTVIFDSNHERVLDSATFAETMYSTLDFQKESVWHIQLTVHDSKPKPEPPPERLVDLVHYAGADDWLSMSLGAWGNCFVDMKRGEAYAVLASTLADRPELVCQVLINTILTNFITRHGYSMLHASALIKDDDILLLQAPHGTGKSTTALRLLMNGYKLLSDSMVYIGERDGDLWMGGFPVGRIKLRTDMLPLFPELAAEAQAEPVRNETKHRVDLMRVDPALTRREMMRIRRVQFCLMERWEKPESRIESLTEEQLWPQIMVNSLHYDTPELWMENLRRIGLLLKRANLHRLRIGTREDEIIKTVNQIW